MSDPVEDLARWIHRTVCRKRGREWLERGIRPIPWARLSEWRRDDYRHVARELLERPPECLLSVPVVVEVNS